jgi:hypothetical protein
MTEPVLCPQCGSEIPAGAPAGLCPKCLLKAAFPSELAREAAATGLVDSSAATKIPPDAGARLDYFGDYELLE